MAEIRPRGAWFPYLEMMYSASLAKVGIGPEDLLYQVHGGRGGGSEEQEITVGGSLAELSEKERRFLPGFQVGFGRSYVGPALWAHLVEAAGSLDGQKVMATAHALSGSVVTMDGRVTWTPDGDIIADDATSGVGRVMQLQRHQWSGDVTSMQVWPPDGTHVEPVLTRIAYEDRPPPWSGQ